MRKLQTTGPWLEASVKYYQDHPVTLTEFKQINQIKNIEKYFGNPQTYFETERRKIKASIYRNDLSDKFKDRFDNFLNKAVDDTFLDDTPEKREEIVIKKWREILYAYAFTQKLAGEQKKFYHLPGAPKKTYLNIFIKHLNLILRTLNIDRRRISPVLGHTHLNAICFFLLGYLKIKKDTKTIRQDLYR